MPPPALFTNAMLSRHGPLIKWCRTSTSAFTLIYGNEQQRYNLRTTLHNAVETATMDMSRSEPIQYTAMAATDDDQQAIGLTNGCVVIWQLGSTVIDQDASPVWLTQMTESLLAATAED